MQVIGTEWLEDPKNLIEDEWLIYLKIWDFIKDDMN